MKKLFLVLAGLFVLNAINAQSVTSGGIYKDKSVVLGFKGAATLSNMSKFPLIESITPTFRNALSPGAGMYVEIPLYNNFSIQPELNYVNKGFKIKEGIDVASEFAGVDIPINGSLRMKLHYVSMPVLAKIHLGDKTKGHSYFMVGPSVNYMAWSGLRVNILNIIPLNIPFPKRVFKPLEFSAVAAVGTEQPLGKKLSFIAEARYEAGISRVLDVPVIQLPVRNRTMSGSMGLQFKL